MKEVMKRSSQFSTLKMVLCRYVLGSPVVRMMLMPVLVMLILAGYAEVFITEILTDIQENTKNAGMATHKINMYWTTAVCSYLLSLGSLYLMSSYTENICREYILDLYRDHISMSFIDFKRIGVGNMISFIDRKSESFAMVLETVTKSLIMASCCVVLVAFRIYSKLGMCYVGVMLGITAIYGGSALVINHYRNLLRLKLNREVDQYRRRVYNNILNHDIIKAYNNEPEEASSLHRSMGLQTSYAKMYWSWLMAANFIGENVFTISMFLVTLYFSSYTTDPKVSSAEYSLFFFLFNNLRIYCVEISNNFAHVSFNITNMSQNRVEQARLDIQTLGCSKTSFDREIAIRDLRICVDGKVLVDKVDTTIRSGEKIVITGPNGSGKSSFVRALLGFLDYEGSILLDSIELREVNKTALRKLIAYSPQESHLFSESVISNIRNGNLDITNEEILEYCKKFDMHEMLCSLNDGYETNVGERGRRLSGGQKQKVSFMRAVVRDSPIFIFDQVTSNLDKESEAHIVSMINEHLRDRTVMMVMQNVDLFDRFDRVYYFDSGSLTYEGDVDTFLRSAQFLKTSPKSLES